MAATMIAALLAKSLDPGAMINEFMADPKSFAIGWAVVGVVCVACWLIVVSFFEEASPKALLFILLTGWLALYGLGYLNANADATATSGATAANSAPPVDVGG